MDFIKTDGLTKKENSKKEGTRAFIREALNEIPEGQGCSMKDLAKEIMEARPNVKTPGSAYIRISGVLKKGSYKRDFEKRIDGNGYTFIVALTATEKEAVEFGL